MYLHFEKEKPFSCLLLLKHLGHIGTLRMEGSSVLLCCLGSSCDQLLCLGVWGIPRETGGQHRSRLRGSCSEQHTPSSPLLSSHRLCFSPHLFPTTVRFLLFPRFEASDTSVAFSLGHLQEHMGGKFDCSVGSRKCDLLE